MVDEGNRKRVVHTGVDDAKPVAFPGLQLDAVE